MIDFAMQVWLASTSKNQVLGLQVCAVKLGTSEQYLVNKNNMETRNRQKDGAVL